MLEYIQYGKLDLSVAHSRAALGRSGGTICPLQLINL